MAENFSGLESGVGIAGAIVAQGLFAGINAVGEQHRANAVAQAAAHARAAGRQRAAAQARAGVLREVSDDLRERLRDAQAVIDDLVDENRALRAEAAELREQLELLQ